MSNNKFGNKNVFFGVVEDRIDPLFLGRCRVRLVGLHSDNKTELPTEDLPWAYPIQSVTSAAMNGIGQTPTGPVEGTWAVVTFIDDSFQQPIILGTIGGIPIVHNTKAEDVEDFLFNTVQPQAKEIAVLDGSGNPIMTGSGGFLVTDRPVEFVSDDRIVAIIKPLVKDSTGIYNVVKLSSNKIVKRVGNRNWRNNNPGNIDYGTYAKNNGAIGTDGRFAIFPTYEIGRAAKAKLLFTGSNYKNLNISRAIARYAPPSENDTTSYQNRVIKAVGSDKILGTMSVAEQDVMLNVMEKHEGYKVGQILAYDGEVPLDESTYEPTKPVTNEKAKNDIVNLPYLQKKIRSEKTADVGFTDPNKSYPKKDWLKEPDTHRLARHQSIDKTIVYTKEQERDLSVAIANSNTVWDQTLVPYNAKYPFNHVMESEAGHVIEVDDTAGNERIHIYHKSGTYIEIDAVGNITRRIKGNECVISENDSKTHIMGTGVLSIDGDFAIEVHKALQIEVIGNAQIKVNGNVNQEVSGNYDCKVGGNIAMQAGGTFSLKSGGLLAGDAAVIHWNSGQSKEAKAVSKFTPSLKILNADSRQSTGDFDMENLTPKEKAAYIQNKIESNNIRREEQPTTKEEDLLPPPIIEPYTGNCHELITQKPYTAKTKLSLNFTLGQLCKGSVPPIDGQHGLTQDQIVCNLMQLCLNVLEPLYKKFGSDMIINSGFRVVGQVRGPQSSKKVSQHELGQAVDVSFQSANSSPQKKQLMFEKAKEIKTSVSFDQLIFESMGPGSAWVHVSYKDGGGRSNVLTMNMVGGVASYKVGLNNA